MLATLGAYTTLIMLFKLKPSKKKEEEIVIRTWHSIAIGCYC